MIISREDEANFPDFKDVYEARRYFLERYGEKFNVGEREYQGSDHSELMGEYIYFDDVDGQPVQIGQTGFVHVVY